MPTQTTQLSPSDILEEVFALHRTSDAESTAMFYTEQIFPLLCHIVSHLSETDISRSVGETCLQSHSWNLLRRLPDVDARLITADASCANIEGVTPLVRVKLCVEAWKEKVK
jgi:hypothetical protein